MRVAIASDHAGFEHKQIIADHLRAQGIDVVDMGPDGKDRVDYPDFAEKVSDAVVAGEVERGVLVCGTGIGMAIAANKIDGIRAANVTTPAFAALAREHNDANVLTVSGRFVDIGINEQIVDMFLETDFGGGRHAGRVEKMTKLEHRGDR